MTQRECGDCHYCCVVYSIEDPELTKRPDIPCKHLSQCGNCSIHETKPQTCKDFLCHWKQGKLPEDMRPDKIDAVFHASDKDGRGKGFEYMVLGHSGDWSVGTKAREALDLLAKLTPVVHHPTAPDLPSEIVRPVDAEGNLLPSALATNPAHDYSHPVHQRL